MSKKAVRGSRRENVSAVKKTLSLDARSLKTYEALAKRLNLSMSGVLRLIASKIEAGEIRL